MVLQGQIIWYEDFNLPNFTTVDNGSTAWTIDLSYDCSGSVTGYYYVLGGQFQSYDTDCDARWISEWIDVSAYPSVDVYGVLDGVGGMETSGTYADSLKIGIRVDGGSTINWLDVYAGTTVQNSVSCGGAAVGADSIQIVIQERSTGGDEIHYFDDVTVSVSNDLPTGGGDTLFSRQDGDWDQTATWSTTVGGSSCSCTPDSNSIVYILCGDVVLIDNDEWAREVHVEFGGRVQWDSDDDELHISSNGTVELSVGSYMWENGRTSAFLEFEGSGTNHLKVYSEDTGLEIDQIRVNHACTLIIEGNGRIDVEDDVELTVDNVTVINNFTSQLYVADDLDVLAANCTWVNDSGELYLDGTFEVLDQNFTMINRDTVFVDLDIHGDNADNGQITNYGQIWVDGDDIELSYNSDNFRIDNYGYFEIVDDLKESGTGAVACEFHNRNGGHLYLGHDDVEQDWEIWASYDSNTVEYYRSGSQLYIFTPQDAYWNLSLTGSGTKQARANLDINGSVSIEGTAAFDVNTSNANLTVAKNWKVTSGTGTPFDYGTETVTFDGSGRQWINSIGGAPFYNVTLNKSADSLVLQCDMTIVSAGNMTFTGGYVSSNSTNRLIFPDNATATGGSDASFVDGLVEKNGNDAFTFPVGDVANYQPISISAPSNTGDQFTAVYRFADPRSFWDETSLGTDIHHVSTEEYWILNRTAGTSAVNVTIGWNANSGGVQTPDSLVVARWDGVQWANEGNGGTTGGASSGTLVTGAPVASFSPFTLASVGFGFTGNTLPVELVSFEAVRMTEDVSISWSTETEIDNERFHVMRSSDGETWQEVGMLQGAGNSSVRRDYVYVDIDAPRMGLNYRLKQVDYNGSSSFSEIEYVPFMGSAEFNVALFPNPVRSGDILHLQAGRDMKGTAEISLIDLTGRVVFRDQIRFVENGIVSLPIQNRIAPGHYTLSIKQGVRDVFSRLVVH